MKKYFAELEYDLRDSFINKILVVSAIVAILAFASTQLRAMEIGWEPRDCAQCIMVLLIALLACFRKRLKTGNKAILLVILFTIGAFPGVYTLGLLAGTIFIFPTAAVIVAVFFSYRATILYIAFSLSFFILVALKFCLPGNALSPAITDLMTNLSHWFVYMACLVLFFIVTATTVYSYRKSLQKLVDTIIRQHDELEKTHQELVKATANVKVLQGLLPICASCKKIRDDKGYWNQIETYISEHSEVDFSHGLCPECMQSLYPDIYESLVRQNKLPDNGTVTPKGSSDSATPSDTKPADE